MSRTVRLLWSFPVDGGGVGVHILRGPSARELELYIVLSLVLLTPMSFGAGATIDLGYISDPAALLNAPMDPSGWANSPPELEFPATSLPVLRHGLREPFAMRVNNAALTAGEFELQLEAAGV